MTSWKLTIDDNILENHNAITIKNTRPESDITSLEFVIDNYKSKTYNDIISKFSRVQLDLANKNSTYTTTFSGEVIGILPINNPEVLTVYCEGYERAYMQTHCNSSYGLESKNPTIVTPREIIQDLTDNYVEKTFGGSTTNWTVDSTNTYVENVHSGLSLTNLTSKYHSNLTMLQRLTNVVNAYALTLGTPEPGIHWIAKPNGTNPRLYVKEIGDTHSNGDWSKYYGGLQVEATITQGDQIKDCSFHHTAKNFANNVVLACNLRKPAYDYWCEDADTNGIWTVDGDGATADDAVNYVVGADSLKFTNDAGHVVKYYKDFTNNLDFDYLGSQESIPYLSLYGRRENVAAGAGTSMVIRLYTTRGTDYFSLALFDDSGWFGAQDKLFMPEKARFYHIRLPVGESFTSVMPDRGWDITGSPDWSNVDGIEFYFNNAGYADAHSFWIDDLHFTGKIIREARDAGAITGGEKERQIFLRLDTAIDDSCTTSDNTGTAARLAASELFRRSEFKTTEAHRGLTGTITIPMKEDLLPGQQLHVHAEKKLDNTYRYDLDMRIHSLIHTVSADKYLTTCNLTSDLWNSITLDTPSAWGIMKDNVYALGHAEARDLKASGIDLGINRLTWDPTV